MGAAVGGPLGRFTLPERPAAQLNGRRRLQRLAVLEHASFLLLLASGAALMLEQEWGLGHARWLDLKLGLVAFLLVPLEAMHAYIAHVWIARGLRQTPAPPPSKDLLRGASMQEMITALAIPLLLIAVPLIVWLSVRKPF